MLGGPQTPEPFASVCTVLTGRSELVSERAPHTRVTVGELTPVPAGHPAPFTLSALWPPAPPPPVAPRERPARSPSSPTPTHSVPSPSPPDSCAPRGSVRGFAAAVCAAEAPAVTFKSCVCVGWRIPQTRTGLWWVPCLRACLRTVSNQTSHLGHADTVTRTLVRRRTFPGRSGRVFLLRPRAQCPQIPPRPPRPEPWPTMCHVPRPAQGRWLGARPLRGGAATQASAPCGCRLASTLQTREGAQESVPATRPPPEPQAVVPEPALQPRLCPLGAPCPSPAHSASRTPPPKRPQAPQS